MVITRRLKAREMYQLWLDGMAIRYIAIKAFCPPEFAPLAWLTTEDGQRCYRTTEDSIRRSCRSALKLRK